MRVARVARVVRQNVCLSCPAGLKLSGWRRGEPFAWACLQR